jgi:hypothetical protein
MKLSTLISITVIVSAIVQGIAFVLPGALSHAFMTIVKTVLFGGTGIFIAVMLVLSFFGVTIGVIRRL